jgi:hypothetical protein
MSVMAPWVVSPTEGQVQCTVSYESRNRSIRWAAALGCAASEESFCHWTGIRQSSLGDEEFEGSVDLLLII